MCLETFQRGCIRLQMHLSSEFQLESCYLKSLWCTVSRSQQPKSPQIPNRLNMFLFPETQRELFLPFQLFPRYALTMIRPQKGNHRTASLFNCSELLQLLTFTSSQPEVKGKEPSNLEFKIVNREKRQENRIGEGMDLEDDLNAQCGVRSQVVKIFTVDKSDCKNI